MESVLRALASMLARSLPLLAVLFPLMWYFGSRPRNRLNLVDFWIVFAVSWIGVALVAPMDFDSGYWRFMGSATLIPIAATFVMNAIRSSREPVTLSFLSILSPWLALAVLAALVYVMPR